MNKIEILEKLVSINTIRDQENKAIMDFIEQYVKQYGFTTKRVDQCLIAKNADRPNVGFLGHTDIVDYATWTGDPFSLTIKDDHIIGLGVCDMKGGIAAILGAITNLDLTKNKMALYFTNDEEISFKGIKTLQSECFPANMIIGEPTNNIPIYGTKGLLELAIEFYGVKTHSSTPEKGKNAIYECVNYINWMMEYYESLKLDLVPDFDIPYTTMNIGTIKGGEFVNSVAGKCQITVDFRIANIEHLITIEQDIQEKLNEYDASMTIKKRVEPKINNGDISFLEAISSQKKTANYVTEASYIESNIIILGPGPITAHEKDEHITKVSFEHIEQLYIEIIKHYNGGDNNENRKI